MSTEIEKLVQKLKDSNPAEREKALDQIEDQNPPDALQLMAPLLNDPDSEVRGTAACNLAVIRDRQAIPLLINIAERAPSNDVKAEALASLAEYQDLQLLKKEEKDELLDCLLNLVYVRDLCRRVRQEIAKLLGNYANSHEAVEALRYLRDNDPDAFVQDFAIMSLSKAPTEQRFD